MHSMAQKDKQSSENRDSMTESAKWGQFSENILIHDIDPIMLIVFKPVPYLDAIITNSARTIILWLVI